MSTITQTICDIETCKETAAFTGVETTVKFSTNQTDGLAATPYLETVKMDLCSTHKQRLMNLTPITGYGAMGNNTYNFA